MTLDLFLLLLGTCRLATIACKGSKSNRRLEDFFLSQWDLRTLPESWANWLQMMRLDMPASFAVWAVKIQQPRLYSKFLLQSWKTFSSFLECRRKFGSNYMRELLGTLPVHSHWALFVSQFRSFTALRSKQIGHNCMHTAGKKNSNKKDIVFSVTKSVLMPIKSHAWSKEFSWLLCKGMLFLCYRLVSLDLCLYCWGLFTVF